MAHDVLGGALHPHILHGLLLRYAHGVVHALRGKDHVRPLVHVVALGVRGLADVLQHPRHAHQQHVAIEQVVHVVERIVVPQVVVDLLVGVRRAHQAVGVHRQNGQLQRLVAEHVRQLPAHLRGVRSAHRQLDRVHAEARVDHGGVAHLHHRRAEDDRVVVVVFGDARVVVALLIVQRQDARLPVLLKRIDDVHRQRAEHEQQQERAQRDERPAPGVGKKAHGRRLPSGD